MKNYNPRAALLAQARDLLTRAAQAAMADGSLPEAELPGFIVEIPADPKNGDVASNLAMAGARAFRKAPPHDCRGHHRPSAGVDRHQF